jgi:hypothetical protein
MKGKSWLLAGAAVLAAGLGWLIQDWVRVQIVRPALSVVSRIGFVLGIYWRTQDQELIWGAFVIVAVLLAAATFSGLWTGRAPRVDSLRGRTGRLYYWADRLKSADEGTYYQWRFSQEIGALIVKKLSLEHGETREELEKQIKSGELDLPDPIQRFLVGSYKKKLHQFYPEPGGKPRGGGQRELKPEQLIDYLERP